MSEQIIVAKFGGTSVADFPAMSRCADIVLADPRIRLIVVSASSGVTNLLVDITKQHDVAARLESYAGVERITYAVLNQLKEQQQVGAAITQLLVELTTLIRQPGEFSHATKDLIQSFGERLSSVLFAQVLAERGALVSQFDVRRVMRTDSQFGKGEPQIEQIKANTDQYLLPLLKQQLIVTQGFIGADAQGQTTTLGRGGSDYSAAIHKISVDLVTTSEISVALTLDDAPGSAFGTAIEPAIAALKQFSEVSVEEGLSLVAVIGNHLHSTRGITGSLFQALERINMRLICHGASRHNLCFLVEDAEAPAVVKELHNALF